MEISERRKRIISRGTDRMALITGRIQSLDPDPIQKSTSFTAPRRDPPAAHHARSSSDSMAANQGSSYEIHPGASHATTSHGDEIYNANNSGLGLSNLHRHETYEPEPERYFSNSPEKPLFGYFLSSITLSEINFSIMSSEDTRVMCSLVLAVLVILYSLVFPPNAVRPKSLIVHRPLYVVVLTDVFIVAARLAPYAQTTRVHKEEKIDDDGLGGALKLMEWGLVLHQTIRALFIDCSFYLVVVVCGLSIV